MVHRNPIPDLTAQPPPPTHCRNGTALPTDMVRALKSCNDDTVSRGRSRSEGRLRCSSCTEVQGITPGLASEAQCVAVQAPYRPVGCCTAAAAGPLLSSHLLSRRVSHVMYHTEGCGWVQCSVVQLTAVQFSFSTVPWTVTT
jgi:hypothetical protein